MRHGPDLLKTFKSTALMGFLGGRVVETDGGPVVCLVHSEETENSVKTPHGGLLSSMLHAAAKAKIVHDERINIEGDVDLVSSNINYISGVKEHGTLITAKADITSVNSSIISVSSSLSANDKELAIARSWYQISALSGESYQRLSASAFAKPTLYPGLKAGDGYDAVQEAIKNVPGYMRALGIEFEDASKVGEVSLVMPKVDERLVRADGTVDLSVIISMADCTGLAGRSAMPGSNYTMSDLEVNILEPVTPDEFPLRVEGTVIKPGSKRVIVEANVLSDEGRWKANAVLGCTPL